MTPSSRDSWVLHKSVRTPILLIDRYTSLPEDSSISLHGLLHVEADLGSGAGAIRVPDLVQELDALKTSFIRDLLMGLARSQGLLDVVGASATEDDNIEERVGTETVCTVYRDTSSLTGSIQTRDDLVFAVLVKTSVTCSSASFLPNSHTSSTVITSPVYRVGIPPTEEKGQKLEEQKWK